MYQQAFGIRYWDLAFSTNIIQTYLKIMPTPFPLFKLNSSAPLANLSESSNVSLLLIFSPDTLSMKAVESSRDACGEENRKSATAPVLRGGKSEKLDL